MRVENPSLVVWKDGAPVLWRAGATACELVTEDTVFPEGVIVGLPSDEVRSTLLSVSPEERKHLAKSLPFMMEEQVAEDVEELHFVSSALDEERYLVAFTRRTVWRPGLSNWLRTIVLKYLHLRRSAYRLRATSVVPSLMVMRWFSLG